MKTHFIRFSNTLLALTGSVLLTVQMAQAATYHWDSNGTTGGFGVTGGIWGTSTFWSTSSAGTAAPANTTITNLDDINFGTLANAYSGTVTLNGDKVARGVTFAGSSNVVLIGNATARKLTLGSGGLTMNDTSTVTLGDGVAGNNLLIGLGSTGQTWTNNAANNLTILNTAATFTRSAGGTIAFNQTGAGLFSMSTTVLPNDATGIVGPWAFFGTGTSTRYAFNNSGTIEGYSGGTAAADAEEFTSSTTNYDFSTTATTTLTASRTANTVRYDGTGNTIDLGASGANTLTANGILAVGGSGTLTIQRTGGTGTLVAGSTGADSELVIAGPQNISITAPISNGTGNSALTYRGTGTLTLSGANTYSGATTVSSGTLVVGSATALGATGKALNVNGSGTLDLNDFDYTFGAFNGDSASAIVTNSAVGDASVLTVGTGNASSNFFGAITGNLSLTKVGTGSLNLGTSNTYIGGTNLNGATTFDFSPGMFGTGIITVNANTTMNAVYGAYPQYANPLHVAGGVTLTTTGSTQYFGQTFTGPVTGSGTIKTGSSGNDANTREKLGLTSASNTFTGTLLNEGGSAIINVNSLGDGGKIQLKTSTGGFQLGAGTATSLLFNTRQVELFGSSELRNENASAAITFTVNTALTYNGTGVRTLTLGGGNTGNNAFNGLVANNSGSAVSLTKAGGGKWILGNIANSYNGVTTVSGGTLEVTKLANGLSNSSLGASANAAGNLLLANATTLRYTGSGDSTDRSFTINASSNNHGAILDASGTGAVNFTNTASPAYGTTNQNRTLTLTGTNTGDNTLAANLANNGTSATAITKTGIGTWVLSGANINTGNTNISGGGKLVLDYGTSGGATDNNKIAGVLTLNNGGGNITLRGGSHVEAVTSTSLTGGGHTHISREVGSTAILSLGAITRNQSAGFTLSLAEDSLATTTSPVAAGILGGGITVGSNWAKVDGSGNIIALAAGDYTSLSTGGTTNTVNYQLTGSQTRAVGATLNSLRIVGDGDDQILTISSGDLKPSIVGAGAGTFGNSGGILYAGGGNNNYTITGAGNVAAQNNNQELIINTFQGILTLDMAVVLNTSILTKTGAGTLVLTKAGTYGSGTFVNQGALRLQHATATGSGGHTVANNAALELANSVAVGNRALTITGSGVSNGGALRNVASNTSSYAGAITIGNGGARINSDATGINLLTLSGGVVTSLFNNVTFGGVGNTTVQTVAISGAGGLIKDGAGSTILTAINTYTGATNINQGILSVGTVATPTGSINNSAVTINGGNFRYNSGTNYTRTLTFTTGTLSGTNWGGSLGGLTIGTGQTISPGNSPGTAVTTSETWAAGGTYEWEINNVIGTAGLDPGWDLINGSAALTITAASGGNEFSIDVMSLTLANAAGALIGFNDATNYNWMIADFLSISGFDTSDFIVDTTQFAVYNSFTGSFGVALGDSPGIGGDNSQIWLTYTAIPEPKTALLGVLGVLLLLRRRR